MERMTEFTDDMKYIIDLEEENKVIKEEKEMLIRQNTLLQESNKKLKDELETATKCSSQEEGKLRKIEKENKKLKEENEKLKETIKDHQLYEKKLEHRIIELEELLHGE